MGILSLATITQQFYELSKIKIIYTENLRTNFSNYIIPKERLNRFFSDRFCIAIIYI